MFSFLQTHKRNSNESHYHMIPPWGALAHDQENAFRNGLWSQRTNQIHGYASRNAHIYIQANDYRSMYCAVEPNRLNFVFILLVTFCISDDWPLRYVTIILNVCFSNSIYIK